MMSIGMNDDLDIPAAEDSFAFGADSEMPEAHVDHEPIPQVFFVLLFFFCWKLMSFLALTPK